MAGDGQVADLRTESSGIATADGAELYFERRGEGPPLLLIAGGGGDCGAYWPLANELASCYTVLTYERRQECLPNHPRFARFRRSVKPLLRQADGWM
jgi:pimeloyl-ACP methyl ester carboxylesterase